MAGPRLVATVILLVLIWDTHQADAQGLTVNIVVTRIDPPDFTPENVDDFRTSSGPHIFTCTATGGTGPIMYQWTSFSPTFQSSNSVITRQSVQLIDDGTHTCMATRGSDTGTATVTVNIVGAGIFVFVGSGVTGTQPNNGLVISNNPGSGFRFRFFCRSDSTTVGIGELLGLDGNPITDDSNFFGFPDSPIGGEFRIENTVGPQTALPPSEQGVYTCRIPLQSGVLREVNIGVYPNGFNDVPTITSPLVFTPGPSPPTLTYTSSTSIATAVTCTRSNSDGTITTVGPLYDGNSKEFGGVTYELTQTVTDRGASTFDNVLTINQALADIVGSSFSCVVSNSIGSSTASNTLPIMGAQITDPGTLAVGEMATIQCTTGVTNIRIEWLLNGEVVVSDATGATELNLELNPVNQNFNGRVYTCRVTVAGGDTISDMFTVMTQLPVVTVDITTSGSAMVGMSTTLMCTVSGADNLEATISFVFTGPNTDSGTGTSLQLLLDPLDLNDAGQYTCTATVSSGLLAEDLVRTDTEDVTLQISAPTVTVLPDVFETIYAGSILTLTCNILLGGIPANLLSGVTVNAQWDGTGGNSLMNSSMITVNPFMSTSVNLYTSRVVFNTISSRNEGPYTCQVGFTHSSQFITDVMTSEDHTVSVEDPAVTAVVALTTGTSRFPNVPPYNTFSLTCTATAPNSVIEPKTFIWLRAITAGGSCNQGVISDSIVNSSVNQPVSTSVLTVTETVAASYRYCCRADLTIPDVTGTQSNLQPITVTGPADPVQPTNLMNDGTTAFSTTIRWTVPNIAFTPENYVVNYGVSPVPLNFMSDERQSGSNFVTENQMFSVELTELNGSTMYDYQVVATNTFGSTTSVIRSFNTTIILPGPPLLFMITVEGPNSLSFSWDAPAPIEGVNPVTNYIVRCTPQLEGIPTPAAVTQGASPPLTAMIDDLASGVLYSCRVAAMNNVGEGIPAEDTATTDETAPNGAPQNFMITPGDDGPASRRLTFFWNPPLPIDRNGMIISYTITCTPDAVMPSTVSTPPGIAGHTVEGFIPFTQYTCSIVATNSVGSGPADSITITTNQDAPDGPPLTQDPGFSTTADNTQRVIFTLQPPEVSNGEVTMYSIRCTPSDSSLESVTETIGSSSEPVEGFNPAADYMCFFSASTSGGDGPETTVGLPVTTLPAAPMITSVMNQSSSEVRVDWLPNQPNINGPGAITHYTVYANNTRMNTNGVVSSYVIGGLEPFQEVTVEVSASTSTGEGRKSQQMTGISSEAPPGPVSNIQWVPQSASSVSVSWSPPQRPNGIVLGYSVVLERYEDGLVINSIDVDNSVFTVPFTDSAVLEAEVPYNVTVTARNSAGMGDPEEIVNFTVQSDSPPPPADVGIVRSSDGTQMTVSWTPLTVLEARSLIQFYQVFYTPGGSSSKRQSGTTCIQSPCDVPGTESSVLIIGLTFDNSYTVIVATVNEGGERGAFTEPKSIPAPAQSLDNTPAIIGGVVAVIVVLIIAGAAVLIVILILRHRNHPSSLSVQKHSESVKWSEVAKSGDPDIKTTECVAYAPVSQPYDTNYEIPTVPCAAYGQSQQIPRIQDEVTYEIIPGETGQPPAEIQRPPGSEYETISPAGNT